MYKNEVTFSWNPSNRKFLREKRKSSLKFKAKNWDFGREEWNITSARKSCWPWETDRERSVKTEKRRDQRGRDTENMRGEKKQREGRKLRAYRETVRQRRQNSCFPRLQRVKKKKNIYRRCDAWERDCFPKKKFGKHPIENKPCFH